jgi:hypothetical protein
MLKLYQPTKRMNVCFPTQQICIFKMAMIKNWMQISEKFRLVYFDRLAPVTFISHHANVRWRQAHIDQPTESSLVRMVAVHASLMFFCHSSHQEDSSSPKTAEGHPFWPRPDVSCIQSLFA